MSVGQRERSEQHKRERPARRPVASVGDVGPSRPVPGEMRLGALRDKSGRIVDFVWDYANATAAHMMYCTADEMPGKRLLDEVAGPLGHPVLVERYRRVIEHGNAQSFAQVHLLDGQQDVVVHHVSRDGDGVIVTLTNLSAERRALERALQGAMRAPMSA